METVTGSKPWFGLGGTFYPEGYMWQVFGGPELPENSVNLPPIFLMGSRK